MIYKQTLEAILKQAEAVGERIEDLVTDATEDQLNFVLGTVALSDLYCHTWGRTYVFIPGGEDRDVFIVDVHRNPEADAAPLLTRLVP
jgi:hypothetical protein